MRIRKQHAHCLLTAGGSIVLFVILFVLVYGSGRAMGGPAGPEPAVPAYPFPDIGVASGQLGYEPPMSEAYYFVDLQDAANRPHNFSFLGAPDIQGFNEVGAIITGVDPATPDDLKKQINPSGIAVLLSPAASLNKSMSLSEFDYKYGLITVWSGYDTGPNSTDHYRGVENETTYLAGYPAFIKPGYIEVFKFDEHTSYMVSANPVGIVSQEMLRVIAIGQVARPTGLPDMDRAEDISANQVLSWAVIATAAAVILAAVLVLQRRRTK